MKRGIRLSWRRHLLRNVAFLHSLDPPYFWVGPFSFSTFLHI